MLSSLSFSPRKVIFAFYLWSFGSFFSCFSCFSCSPLSSSSSSSLFFFSPLLNLLSPSIREASLNFLPYSPPPFTRTNHLSSANSSTPLIYEEFQRLSLALTAAIHSKKDLLPSSRIYFRQSFVYDFPPYFFHTFLFLIFFHSSSRDPLLQLLWLRASIFFFTIRPPPQRISLPLLSVALTFLFSLPPYLFSFFTFAFCPWNFDPPFLSLSLVSWIHFRHSFLPWPPLSRSRYLSNQRRDV